MSNDKQTDEPATDEAPAGATRSGDDVIAEAKQLAHEGGNLTGEHVRALEHPEEFAGRDVPVADES